MRLLLYHEGRFEIFVWHWLIYWGIGRHTLIHFDGTWTSAQAWKGHVNRSSVPSRMRALVTLPKLPGPKSVLMNDKRDLGWVIEEERVLATVMWALVLVSLTFLWYVSLRKETNPIWEQPFSDRKSSQEYANDLQRLECNIRTVLCHPDSASGQMVYSPAGGNIRYWWPIAESLLRNYLLLEKSHFVQVTYTPTMKTAHIHQLVDMRMRERSQNPGLLP